MGTHSPICPDRTTDRKFLIMLGSSTIDKLSNEPLAASARYFFPDIQTELIKKNKNTSQEQTQTDLRQVRVAKLVCNGAKVQKIADDANQLIAASRYLSTDYAPVHVP